MGVRQASYAESALERLDQKDVRPVLGEERRQTGQVAGERRTTGERPDLFDACSSDVEAEIFSLVYRQMHVLYGRWRADFDDLAQAAAEQALRGLPSFRRESELSTWTYRICYRVVLRHRRWYRRWLQRFTLDAPFSEAVDNESAEAQLEQRERLARLASALDGLSEKRRAVILLRDIDGLKIPEIASIVQATEATVRSRLRDGRRQLAELLRADPYFGAGAGEEEDQ